MKAEQKRLQFRSSILAAQQYWFSIMGMETASNRITVAKIIPEGWYKLSAANKATFASLYTKFQIGMDYAKQEFIDWATANAYSLTETSAESPNAVVYTLDIGTTTAPSAGSITTTGATISWTNTNPTRNTSINVYVSSNAGLTYTLFAKAANNATSQVITGLTTGTQYRVKVAPANPFGESAGLTVNFTTS